MRKSLECGDQETGRYIYQKLYGMIYNYTYILALLLICQVQMELYTQNVQNSWSRKCLVHYLIQIYPYPPITDNSKDSTVCTCPVPCHRVVYTPDLSYAYLSDATVSKIWKGQSDRLADVTQRYKKAKEIVHRVDPEIVAKDKSLFGNVKDVFDDITTQCDKAMMLLGFSTTSQKNTLYGTAVSLHQVMERKLNKLRSALDFSITLEAQSFMNDYMEVLGTSYWASPPYVLYVTALFHVCAMQEQSGLPAEYYCYRPYVPEIFKGNILLRMQEFILNTTMLATNPQNKFK